MFNNLSIVPLMWQNPKDCAIPFPQSMGWALFRLPLQGGNFSQLKSTLFNFSQLTLCPLCKCDPGVSIIPVFCDRGFLKLSCASVAKSWSLFRLPLRSDTREKKNGQFDRNLGNYPAKRLSRGSWPLLASIEFFVRLPLSTTPKPIYRYFAWPMRMRMLRR